MTIAVRTSPDNAIASLADLVAERMRAFPSSGEINFRLADPDAAIARVVGHFAEQAQRRDETDGISLEFQDWRFNLRASNTEPLVRVNVESPDRERTDALASRVLQLVRDAG